MGVTLWLLCGAAAFAGSRAIAAGRPQSYAAEIVAAMGIAFVAGVAATALDFGGWNELDWRGGALALFCALAAVAVLRIVKLARGSIA